MDNLSVYSQGDSVYLDTKLVTTLLLQKSVCLKVKCISDLFLGEIVGQQLTWGSRLEDIGPTPTAATY